MPKRQDWRELPVSTFSITHIKTTLEYSAPGPVKARPDQPPSQPGQISPSFTRPGPPQTQSGQPPRGFGQPLTHSGPPLTQPGQPLTHSGQSLAHSGPPLTYSGQPLTEFGQPLKQPGPPLTQSGQPLTQFSQPSQLIKPTQPGQPPSPTQNQRPLPTQAQSQEEYNKKLDRLKWLEDRLNRLLKEREELLRVAQDAEDHLDNQIQEVNEKLGNPKTEPPPKLFKIPLTRSTSSRAFRDPRAKPQSPAGQGGVGIEDYGGKNSDPTKSEEAEKFTWKPTDSSSHHDLQHGGPACNTVEGLAERVNQLERTAQHEVDNIARQMDSLRQNLPDRA